MFVGLESVAALSALHPDHRDCFAGAGRHWRSRMFSPAYGVVEDAATGSAAGPLAIHLLQGVEIGRPSRMYARAEGAGERVSTVEVSGNGAAFAEGRAYLWRPSPKAGPTCERAERRNAVMGVNANISESLTGTIEAPFPEFEAPPANPMEVLRNWLERARRYGVREPRALALATVDGQGRASTRIVVIAELGERGVVFAR